MVEYNLHHLTQPSHQGEPGPIQDDEALLLFALIRVTRIRRILELGSAYGYSSKNFCVAVGGEGTVYSVSIPEVTPKFADNHVVYTKNISELTVADLGGEPIDLVFFDCHDYAAELGLYWRLSRAGIITDKTLLVLHDTNLWPVRNAANVANEPNWPTICYEVEGGWVFCPPERQLVNDFHAMGYDVINLGTKREVHGPALPYRCGLSIACKFAPLALKYGPRLNP